jgi:hypothetical protein
VTRGELVATFHKAFGVDWTKQYMSAIRRPIKIANLLDEHNRRATIKELFWGSASLTFGKPSDPEAKH